MTLAGRLAEGRAFLSRMSVAARATTGRHGVRASKSQVGHPAPYGPCARAPHGKHRLGPIAELESISISGTAAL